MTSPTNASILSVQTIWTLKYKSSNGTEMGLKSSDFWDPCLPSWVQALTDIARSWPEWCKAVTVTRYCVADRSWVSKVEFSWFRRVTVRTVPEGSTAYSTWYCRTRRGCSGPQLTRTWSGPDSEMETVVGLRISGTSEMAVRHTCYKMGLLLLHTFDTAPLKPLKVLPVLRWSIRFF